jgi:hypothetical protein
MGSITGSGPTADNYRKEESLINQEN